VEVLIRFSSWIEDTNTRTINPHYGKPRGFPAHFGFSFEGQAGFVRIFIRPKSAVGFEKFCRKAVSALDFDAFGKKTRVFMVLHHSAFAL
jgi:hypothetical protein